MYFSPFFSPMRYASTSGFEKKVLINNNLSAQTNDVMFNSMNPENPDSKSVCNYQILPCQEKIERGKPLLLNFISKPKTLI